GTADRPAHPPPLTSSQRGRSLPVLPARGGRKDGETLPARRRRGDCPGLPGRTPADRSYRRAYPPLRPPGREEGDRCRNRHRSRGRGGPMSDFDPGLKSRIREAFEKPVTLWAKITPTGFLLEGDDSPVQNLEGRVIRVQLVRKLFRDGALICH